MTDIRIASFNAFNLVRVGMPYYNKPAYTDAEFARKKAWMAALIDAARMDLVGFQEVFHREALEEIVGASRHLAGATVIAPGADRSANEGPDPRQGGAIRALGPKVALATRLPVLRHESIVAFDPAADLRVPSTDPRTMEETLVSVGITHFQRPVLKADVMLPGGIEATVFVAHLKSKRPLFLEGEDEDDPRVTALGEIRALLARGAEAAALRVEVLKVVDDPEESHGERGRPVIVLGDLNDDVHSVSTQVVGGKAPWQFLPFEKKQRLWDVQLYNAHDIQARQSMRNVAFSHIFEGRFEILDHILVSQEFIREFRKGVGEVRNVRVYNDHITDERFTSERRDRVASDHGIPVAEVRMNAQ